MSRAGATVVSCALPVEELRTSSMVLLSGTVALECWCRRSVSGYPGVEICNMGSSWQDGLAFCALIHRYRPDLLDFAALDRDDLKG